MEPNPLPREINWFLFFIVLLAPAACSMLAAAAKAQSLAVYAMFLGSGIAALICGFLVAHRLQRLLTRVLLALGLALLLYFVSVALCFAGCALGAH